MMMIERQERRTGIMTVRFIVQRIYRSMNKDNEKSIFYGCISMKKQFRYLKEDFFFYYLIFRADIAQNIGFRIQSYIYFFL